MNWKQWFFILISGFSLSSLVWWFLKSKRRSQKSIRSKETQQSNQNSTTSNTLAPPPTDEQLSNFQLATQHVKTLKNITDEQQLQLYGLFKQATVGKCQVEKPSMLDFVASAKWEAWNSLGSEMSKQQAMQKYVETVQKFDSKFNPALSPTVPSRSVANQKNAESIEDDDESQPAKKTGAGPVMSRPSTDSNTDDKKDLCSYAVDGNKAMIEKLLSQDVSVDYQDEDGTTALHYACDRGNLEIVKILLQHGASIEIKDSLGSTCLHNAAMNSHLEIIQLLLDAGASLDITDNDGLTPRQLLIDNNLMPEIEKFAKLTQYKNYAQDLLGEQHFRRAQELEKAGKFDEAATHYQESVNRGYNRSYTNLATLYLKGKGVQTDKKKAFEMYMIAAKKMAHPRAMFNMAAMLEAGDGVEMDLVQALSWYEKTSISGDKRCSGAAKTKAEALKKQLNQK